MGHQRGGSSKFEGRNPNRRDFVSHFVYHFVCGFKGQNADKVKESSGRQSKSAVRHFVFHFVRILRGRLGDKVKEPSGRQARIKWET